MADATPVVPGDGAKIALVDGRLRVPDRPIIPFIEGDGVGRDVWRASVRVLDAAVEKAYRGRRRIAWTEVYAGEKAFTKFNTWLPDETVESFREYLVGIKGPLTTPVGGGIRSLNVALRQLLDLYVCLRPVRWFHGVPSPVKNPQKIDMVIFRENTEDIYAGIEWEAGSEQARRFLDFLRRELPRDHRKIRFPESSGFGVKPVSREGTERLVRAALEYALRLGRRRVTFVHKGNIMKFTEGAFRDWGYEVARTQFGDGTVAEGDAAGASGKVVVKDRIADAMFQQLLLRPDEYSVLATPNLNGDYLSDAAAAQVGGLGMAPGANVGEEVAVFEATHGTAPKYANQDRVNPGSLILSGVMMLEHMGWDAAAERVVRGLERAIANRTVTYDLERQMEGAKLVSTSGFAEGL